MSIWPHWGRWEETGGGEGLGTITAYCYRQDDTKPPLAKPHPPNSLQVLRDMREGRVREVLWFAAPLQEAPTLRGFEGRQEGAGIGEGRRRKGRMGAEGYEGKKLALGGTLPSTRPSP